MPDEILAHSDDEGEWQEEPEQIESRPSGMQVISARLPSLLAEQLLARAASRSVSPSVLVREAVAASLHEPAAHLSVSTGGMMRVLAPLAQCGAENRNLVVGATIISASANVVTPDTTDAANAGLRAQSQDPAE